jgi:hypothetical protein
MTWNVRTASGKSRSLICSANAFSPSGPRARFAGLRSKQPWPILNPAWRFSPEHTSFEGDGLKAVPFNEHPYCGGLLVPCGGAGTASGAAWADGWLCWTPIALPETTRFTRRFCALPAAVELSAMGLLMP